MSLVKMARSRVDERSVIHRSALDAPKVLDASKTVEDAAFAHPIQLKSVVRRQKPDGIEAHGLDGLSKRMDVAPNRGGVVARKVDVALRKIGIAPNWCDDYAQNIACALNRGDVDAKRVNDAPIWSDGYARSVNADLRKVDGLLQKINVGLRKLDSLLPGSNWL